MLGDVGDQTIQGTADGCSLASANRGMQAVEQPEQVLVFLVVLRDAGGEFLTTSSR